MAALKDVRVLAFEHVLAAPFCTLLLAQLGAEVIKVEPPGGEQARKNPPFIDGDSGYFMSLNRAKKSLVLNLKTEKGKELFKVLASKSDVLIANYRPGTLEKMGLGYDVLKELHPGLIYVTVSGFGYPEFGESPYWERPAYDIVAQAMGGIMSITGPAGGSPTRVGVSMGDIAAGLYAAVGSLAALHQRHVSGLGQWVDVSMVDSIIALAENAIIKYSITGEPARPVGNRHPLVAPFDTFEALDGYVAIAAGNEKAWGGLARAMGRPELAEDPRFNSNVARLENHQELKGIIEEWTRRRTKGEIEAVLTQAGCPVGPVSTIEEVVRGNHARARQMVASLSHAAGPLLVTGLPVKLSMTPGTPGSMPPSPGEHTAQVLRELAGVGPEELDRLRREGVVE